MPVKIRCTGCQKSLNVPDAARGKVVKCPSCETKLKVPAADDDGEEVVQSAPPRKAAAGAKAAGRKPAAKRPASEEDFLSNLDLDRLEDKSIRVCPKCGNETDLEAESCPKCGIDFSTGQLTAQAARRKGKRGPDPREFFGAAWKDSWQFLMKNKNLAFRTGMYWTLFGVLSLNCMFLALWCTTVPPKLFWLALSWLFSAGSLGWYWFLNHRIIEHTMAQAKKLKDVKFDLILNAGLGVKAGIWAWGLTFPLILFPFTMTALYVAMTTTAVTNAAEKKEEDQKEQKIKQKDRVPLTEEEMATAIASVSPAPMAFSWLIVMPAVALASLTFPVSQVHLTARYPWTAWSLWNMVKASLKNFVPVAYFWLMAIAVYSLFIVLGIVVSVIWAQSDTLSQANIMKFLAEQGKWALEKTGNSFEDPGIIGYLILWALILVSTALALAPSCFMMAFPSVYMMRVNGLFGYYNRENLEMEQTKKANELAGFWPRWVAAIADFVILCGIGLVVLVIANVLDIVVARLGLDFSYDIFGLRLYPFFLIGCLAIMVITMLYFASSESGPAQGTPGMRGIGLIVTDMEGKRIKTGQGFMRFFGRVISLYFTGSIGFLMAAFTQNKQTLHDSMTKTLVVWKGDDEATEH